MPVQAKKPNVLLVVIDDMGWSDVGFHDPTFSTPNIDQLSREGIQLDSFYVSPTCTPSRAQLMTGRYNYRIGLQDSVIHSTEPRGVPLDQSFLSNKLKSSGYTTAAIGKWHLGMHMPQYTPLKRGFDKHYGIFTGGGDHFKHISASQEFTARYSNSSLIFTGYNLWEDGEVSPDNFVDIHTTDLYTQKAISYLNEFKQSENPWFMYMAFQAVHDPIQTAPHWYEQGKCSKLSKNIEQSETADIDWDKRKILCGMMAQVDNGMLMIRESLEEMDMWDDTIVIFMSDNGGIYIHGSSNLPLNGQKGQYYEGGVRVPALLSGGYVTSALKSRGKDPYIHNDLVHITDVHSTILGLAGYKDETRLDGIDQWESLISKLPPARKNMVINLNSHFFAGSGAVRSGKYKLIKNADPKESTIYNKVRNVLSGKSAEFTESNLFKVAKAEYETLLNPVMLMFDISRNPSERTDGACAEYVECNNLYYNAEFSKERKALEAFFEGEAKTMVPATFKWEDDGPLTNPDNFGKVWQPWRDENGVPLAMYQDIKFASSEIAYMLDSSISISGAMASHLVVIVFASAFISILLGFLVVHHFNKKKKRGDVRSTYTEI